MGLTGPDPPPSRRSLATALDDGASRAACLAGRAVVPQTDGVRISGVGMVPLQHHRGTTMDHYAGIDVSLEYSSICVVDATGQIVREDKIASEPEVLIAWFSSLGYALTRIGLEAGPLSQWLYAAMKKAGLAVGLFFRDAARARCLQGDAGQVRSQRRARDCAADAAWLVSAGALQVDWGPGDSRRADRTQVG